MGETRPATAALVAATIGVLQAFRRPWEPEWRPRLTKYEVCALDTLSEVHLNHVPDLLRSIEADATELETAEELLREWQQADEDTDNITRIPRFVAVSRRTREFLGRREWG